MTPEAWLWFALAFVAVFLSARIARLAARVAALEDRRARVERSMRSPTPPPDAMRGPGLSRGVGWERNGDG